MTLNPEPIPVSEPISTPRNWLKYPNPRDKDPSEGRIRDPWMLYMTNQGQLITNSPSRIALEEVTAQSASISATALNIGEVPAGLYRISPYVRITVAAGVSSSLTVTFSWTDGGVSPSFSFPAITGNTTTTVQPDKSLVLEIDDGTPITYATTYASNPAGAMQYKLSITVERLAA